MGKASSAKKVARAARTGSKSARNRPKMGFPLAVLAVVVLGLAVVVAARTNHQDLASADTAPILNKDHFHAAYGFYTCDKFERPYPDLPNQPDVQGLHSHAIESDPTTGDGIIHVHPFRPSASGENARLKVWQKMVGLEFFDDGWKLPDGTEYRKGSATCGDKPAKIAVYRWNADDATAPVEVFESNFANIPLIQDRTIFTFAVLPEGAPEPPPKPDSASGLDNLSDVEGGAGAGAGAGAAGASGIDPSQLPAGIDPSALNPSGAGGADPASGASVQIDPAAGAGAGAPTGQAPAGAAPAGTP